MARMLRNLIEWERNIITLREELRFLDEFLYIPVSYTHLDVYKRQEYTPEGMQAFWRRCLF